MTRSLHSRAFVVTAPHTGAVADLEIAADEVTVRVEAVGLCQRDAALWSGEIVRPYPLGLGHEVVGVVVDAPAASGLAAGMRVAGMGNQALATLMNVPAWQIAPVAGRGSHLALVEPLACAINARMQDQNPSGPALVTGLGLLGQMIAALLAAGGRRVYGVDQDTNRLNLAATNGVVPVSDDRLESLIPTVSSAFECSGDERVLWALSEGLAAGSGLVLVAHHRHGSMPAAQLLDRWHLGGIAVRNAVPRTATDMRECVRLAARQPIDLAQFGIARFRLADSALALTKWPRGDIFRNVVVLEEC